MITRISGTLEGLGKDSAVVALSGAGGMAVEVYLPGFAVARLGASIGSPVVLHTLLFVESTAQGATLFPRLAGFPTAMDRSFFELLVTVKGIGHRKALRVMALPTGQIAGGIADRDASLLQSLPEIGKRMAETIVVTLKDKVDGYVAGSAAAEQGATPKAAGSAAGVDADADALGGVEISGGALAREAIAALVALGEPRVAAAQWVDRVMSDDDPPTDVADVLQGVYRVRSGG
ncbi:MAG: Holliday junction branch migration protein RuvA [Planctomycetota bacterium]